MNNLTKDDLATLHELVNDELDSLLSSGYEEDEYTAHLKELLTKLKSE